MFRISSKTLESYVLAKLDQLLALFRSENVLEGPNERLEFGLRDVRRIEVRIEAVREVALLRLAVRRQRSHVVWRLWFGGSVLNLRFRVVLLFCWLQTGFVINVRLLPTTALKKSPSCKANA